MTAPAVPAARHPGAMLAVACVPAFMIGLDALVVTIALTAIRRELDASVGQLPDVLLCVPGGIPCRTAGDGLPPSTTPPGSARAPLRQGIQRPGPAAAQAGLGQQYARAGGQAEGGQHVSADRTPIVREHPAAPE